MLVSEQEISELKDFVCELNELKKSVVIVEGKRDSAALRKLGYTGKLLEFHKYAGIVTHLKLCLNLHTLN